MKDEITVKTQEVDRESRKKAKLEKELVAQRKELEGQNNELKAKQAHIQKLEEECQKFEQRLKETRVKFYYILHMFMLVHVVMHSLVLLLCKMYICKYEHGYVRMYNYTYI